MLEAYPVRISGFYNYKGLALPAIGALLSKIPVIPSFCSEK